MFGGRGLCYEMPRNCSVPIAVSSHPGGLGGVVASGRTVAAPQFLYRKGVGVAMWMEGVGS